MAAFLSSRAQWSAPVNRLTVARRDREARGLPLLDLTESNPTRAGLTYSADTLADIMAAAAAAPYAADPRGLRHAREALAAALSIDAAPVDPDDLFLTASTSEAYSFLFKLLTDCGDSVLAVTPSYPLLEHIAALESIKLDTVPFEFHPGRAVSRHWQLNAADVGAHLHERTRALVVVQPNNPTGHFLTRREQQSIATLCAERRVAVISDEVFIDFALPRGREIDRASAAGAGATGLTFSLGGLSKSAALPHYKLAWIRLAGEERLKRAAAEALELICDTFLSVATPVQVALPRILAGAPEMRATIIARLEANLGTARSLFRDYPAVELIEPEGGWSLVLRVPRLGDDETLALELIEEAGVVVQPGFFFDFSAEGFIVVSLLTAEAEFQEGIKRVARHLASR